MRTGSALCERGNQHPILWQRTQRDDTPDAPLF
jgi:hypothetical protein